MGEKVVIFYLPKFPRRANAFCSPNCNCKANIKILVPVYFLPSALLLIQDRSCLWSLEASYLGQPLLDCNILQLSEFYRTEGKAYIRVSLKFQMKTQLTNKHTSQTPINIKMKNQQDSKVTDKNSSLQMTNTKLRKSSRK